MRYSHSKLSIEDFLISFYVFVFIKVRNALQYFKSVISTNKLEMLADNGTVVLESISSVHAALQTYGLNEHSSALISATTQVYDALGKLIKLCDEVILSEDDEKCASLSKENVESVVELVDNAVQQLANLANEKLAEQQKITGTSHNSAGGGSKTTPNTLQRPVIDVAAQRTSLPDIPLTPRDRDILEQTAAAANVRPSFSTENILRDTDSPPPKPPLPNRHTDPPPLPPKRRPTKPNSSFHELDTVTGTNDNTFLHLNVDRTSLRSRSPEDNSSLLSAGSLDSALNHSREEEELKNLTIDSSHDEVHPCSDIGLIKNTNIWSDEAESIQHANNTTMNLELHNHRNSNESGFVSIRSSTQSVSTKQVTTTSTSTLMKSSAAVMQKLNSSIDAIVEQNVSRSHTEQSSSSSSSTVIQSTSMEGTNITNTEEESFADKPPLPEKTRKSSSVRRVSTYDNVDEADAAELR